MTYNDKCAINKDGSYKLNDGSTLTFNDADYAFLRYETLTLVEDVNSTEGLLMKYKDYIVNVDNPDISTPNIIRKEVSDIVEVDGKYQTEEGVEIDEEHQKTIVKRDGKFYVYEIQYRHEISTTKGANMESVLVACLDKLNSAALTRSGRYAEPNVKMTILKIQEALLWLKNGLRDE